MSKKRARLVAGTVVSEVLNEGLRPHAVRERSDGVLDAYKQAFASFSEDEILILDGVILEPVSTPRGGR